MSEEPKKEEQNAKPQEPKDIVLTITMLASNGQIQVSGPGNTEVYDEPLCLWLLDKAKDIIKATNVRAMSSKIIQPRVHGINRIRGAFGRR